MVYNEAIHSAYDCALSSQETSRPPQTAMPPSQSRDTAEKARGDHAQGAQAQAEESVEYPNILQRNLIMTVVLLAAFLVTLVRRAILPRPSVHYAKSSHA